MLIHERELAGLHREHPFCQADCFVLLQDASRLFCQYVSEFYGEPSSSRWAPALPELLLSHPERCQETLALVEREDFKPISYLQFSAA